MTRKNSAQLRLEYGELLESELKSMASGNPGIQSAQVCTSDGFEVASTHQDPESGRRLAAMVSSMQALGTAVAEETGLGDYRNLIVEGTAGKCIMMAIPGTGGEMLLTVMANAQLAFGIFLVLCKSTCQSISARVSTVT